MTGFVEVDVGVGGVFGLDGMVSVRVRQWREGGRRGEGLAIVGSVPCKYY